MAGASSLLTCSYIKQFMSESAANLDTSASLPAILGYLNFSEGKPDSRFQKQLNDAYAALAQGPDAARPEPARRPWQALHEILTRKLDELKKESGAFQDARQAEAALDLTFS